MSVEQQKGTTNRDGWEDGGTGTPPPGQQQTLTVFDPQRALTSHLMEQVCDPQNLVRAYRRVRSNKGKPGVDGMTVHALADWLRNNHAALQSSLLDGTYRPQPVRTVQFRKPEGGQRQLGISVAGSSRTAGDSAGAPSHPGPRLFQLQLRISPWTRRSYGVRTGAEIRGPGGARDCRRSGSGEIFRPCQSRYLDVPARAQDR